MARLRIHLSRLDAAAQEGGPVEAAWQAVGKAELAVARGRNSAALWRKATDRWEAIDRPYHAAITYWREAEAAVEAGDRGDAQAPAAQALDTARRLGSEWLVEEVESLIARARLQQPEPSPDGASEPAQEEEAPFGLTARELQVLGLVAEGATNRQIGAALFMAEKTASVHVSRILMKLGVSSRTQAAAVAHRLRLG